MLPECVTTRVTSRQLSLSSLNMALPVDAVDGILLTISRCIRETGRSLTQSSPNRTYICHKLRQAIDNTERIRPQISSDKADDIRRSLEQLLALANVNSDSGSHTDTLTDDTGAMSDADSEQTPAGDAYDTDNGHLRLLFQRGFSGARIASHLGISVNAVYKRLRKMGMSIRGRYSPITDDALDNVVMELHQRHPRAGTEMMTGYLLTRGHYVQRERVRASLNRVDPLSVAHCWSMAVSRRVYRVASPNSLWHIDGYMRLVRWGFAIHGCIDGFSRLITYLHCSNNNLSSTVLTQFVKSVIKFGLPSKVRSDYGGENMKVAMLLNLLHGDQTNRNSHITGESVHNQRIERLWRDVYLQVGEYYYNIFYSLEDRNLLSVDNGQHILCLQLVYLKEINRSLKEFQAGWNSHRLRTEGNRTPEQIWIDGILCQTTFPRAVDRLCEGRPLEDSLESLLHRFGLTRQQVTDIMPDNTVESVVVRHSDLSISEDHQHILEEAMADQETLEEKYKAAVCTLESL